MTVQIVSKRKRVLWWSSLLLVFAATYCWPGVGDPSSCPCRPAARHGRRPWSNSWRRPRVTAPPPTAGSGSSPGRTAGYRTCHTDKLWFKNVGYIKFFFFLLLIWAFWGIRNFCYTCKDNIFYNKKGLYKKNMVGSKKKYCKQKMLYDKQLN